MSHSRRWHVPGLLLVSLLVMGVYAPGLRFDFVRWDDDINITDNALITAPWSRATVGQIFAADQAMRFKPVYWLAARSIHAVAGFSPGAWHAVGLGWHVLATILFALVLRRVLRLADPALGPRADVAALVGALVWAVHPLRAETVAWATAGTYPLTGVWLLASFACYVQSIDANRGRRWWLGGAWASAVLGYGTYPVGVTYGLWLIVFDGWLIRRGLAPDRPREWRWWLKHAGFLLPAALAVGVTVWTRFTAPGIFTTAPDVAAVGLPMRLLMGLAGWSALAWRAVWPVDLTPNLPPLHFSADGTFGLVVLGAVFAATALGIAWRVRRSRPGVTLVIAGFALLTLPCIGLTERPNWPVDRYSYLGHLILIGGLTDWATQVRRDRQVILVAAVILLVGAEAFATRRQTLIWANTESLFTSMEQHPRFAEDVRQQGHIYVLWGRHLVAQGDPARAADMFNRAQAVYLAAIRVAVARQHYAEALSLLSHEEHHFGLTPVLRREKGAWLLRLHRPAEAAQELRRALTEAPDDPRAQVLLRAAESEATGPVH